ncbi:MAG: hypothetical protein WC858_02175 [Parcubacteria group bacterium]|jgi:hypothetical protein
MKELQLQQSERLLWVGRAGIVFGLIVAIWVASSIQKRINWTELSAHHVTVKQLALHSEGFSDGLIVMVKGFAEPTGLILDMNKHGQLLPYDFYDSRLHVSGDPFIKVYAQQSIYTEKGCEVLAVLHHDASGLWLEALAFYGDGQTWRLSEVEKQKR